MFLKSLPRLHRFIVNDSGATTVDWVVLTGSVVGLAIGASAAVRSGTGVLGSSIGSGLNDASVRLICQNAPYELAFYTGENAAKADDVNSWSDRAGDDELLANYREQQEKLRSIIDGGADQRDIDEVTDVLYLMHQEIEERGMRLDEDTPGFDDFLSALHAGSGTDGCASDYDGGTTDGPSTAELPDLRDYEALIYTAEDIESEYRYLTESDRETRDSRINEAVKAIEGALDNGRNEDDARKGLDILYLGIQAMTARGEDASELTAQYQDYLNRFNRIYG